MSEVLKPRERYLPAGELQLAFSPLGLDCSYRYALCLVRDCPAAIRGSLRLSDALDFLNRYPDYKPLSRTFDPTVWKKRMQEDAEK